MLQPPAAACRLMPYAAMRSAPPRYMPHYNTAFAAPYARACARHAKMRDKSAGALLCMAPPCHDFVADFVLFSSPLLAFHLPLILIRYAFAALIFIYIDYYCH